MTGKRVKNREEQQLSRTFHCLADPARRKILALLREAGELQVGQVGRAFAMTQNGVSKHLKVLEEANLVVRRVEGRVHWISANWSTLEPAYTWLHFHRHFWNQRLEAFVDYAKNQAKKDSKETP
jgi:DNA-binding transcriptional ArsR family regulator